MIKKSIKNNKAFVLLFAVTLSAILLSVALGVSNIAFKEVKFSTSAKDTNDAFFAADTGIECAAYYDRPYDASIESQNINAFTGSSSFVGPMTCAGTSTSLVSSSAFLWNFTVNGLGIGGQSCAKVTVDKTYMDNTPEHNHTYTIITSDGYSNCSPTSNTVQRELQLIYGEKDSS